MKSIHQYLIYLVPFYTIPYPLTTGVELYYPEIRNQFRTIMTQMGGVLITTYVIGTTLIWLVLRVIWVFRVIGGLDAVKEFSKRECVG